MSDPSQSLDPATETAWRERVRRALDDNVDHRDDFRRVAIHVDALIGASRVEAAAEIYRGALERYPQWAEGYYNLALIEAHLGNYAAAITGARRYLFILPEALDARTVRDQVYQWEARLPASR